MKRWKAPPAAITSRHGWRLEADGASRTISRTSAYTPAASAASGVPKSPAKKSSSHGLRFWERAKKRVAASTAVRREATGADRRQDFAFGQVYARGEAGVTERSAEPAGPEAERGGVEDGALEGEAVVLHVHRAPTNRAAEEGPRAFYRAVCPQLPELRAVLRRRLHQLEANAAAERARPGRGDKILEARAVFRRESPAVVTTPRRAPADNFGYRPAPGHRKTVPGYGAPAGVVESIRFLHSAYRADA